MLKTNTYLIFEKLHPSYVRSPYIILLIVTLCFILEEELNSLPPRIYVTSRGYTNLYFVINKLYLLSKIKNINKWNKITTY